MNWNLKGLLNLRKILRAADERGFLFAELAIALPLLILLIYSLANLTTKIFEVTRNQVADYVLETEIQDVIERISLDARAAVSFTANNQAVNSDLGGITFFYNTLSDDYRAAGILQESRRYTPNVTGSGKINMILKRRNDNYFTTPITGGNFFGDTKVTRFKFSEPRNNVLHVTLEMQSLVSGRKIKISTAFFMPNCLEKEISNE